MTNGKLVAAVSLLCLILATTGAVGQPKGAIEGRVVDAATGEPLPGAQVIVEGTFLGTTSDLSGRYWLRLPPGSYTLTARMIGYEARSHRVEVTAGDTFRIDFRLRQTVLRAPEVVVTASKRHQPLAESPQSVAVLSRNDIAQRNRLYLDEYLQYAPGVTLVSNQVNIRGSSGYSRGAGSRVLILVDGVPMMPGDSGDIKWDVIPIDQVERLEIVKGAGSALYGSSALGGVINVITQDPEAVPRTSLRALVGAYDKPPYPEWRWTDRLLRFSEWSVSHSNRIGRVAFTANLKRSESMGYKMNGNYSRWNLFAKGLVRPSLRDRVEILLMASTDNYGANLMWPDQSRALEVSPDAIGDYIRSAKMHLAAQWRRVVNPRFAYRVRLSGFGNGWTDYFHDSHDYSRARQYGLETQLDYLIAGRHPLTAGTEVTYGRVRANIFGKRQTYDLAAYSQCDLRVLSTLTVNVGLRYDFSNRNLEFTEQQVSPKLGVVWRPRRGTSLRANVGSGFRAASVAEAYSKTYVSGIRVEPNPNLKAERGLTAEIAASQAWRSLRINLAVFHNRFRNLIEPMADVTNTVRFENVTDARITGFEIGTSLGAQTWLGTFEWGVNYLYLDTEDLELHQPLAYRSRHTVQTHLEWRRGRVRLGFDYRYLSRVERVQVYYRDDRVPQKVLDLRAAIDTPVGEISLEVDNALNYAYTQIERNLEPIRNYRLAFRREL